MSEVIDKRKAPWLWFENAIIDRFGRVIGVEGVAVYAALARYAGRDRKCFPTQEKIAEQLGSSRSTVMRAMKRLKKQGLIDIQYRQGSSVYTLLDPPDTVCPPDAPESSDDLRCQPDTAAVSQNDICGVTLEHEQDTLNETQEQELLRSASAEADVSVTDDTAAFAEEFFGPTETEPPAPTPVAVVTPAPSDTTGEDIPPTEKPKPTKAQRNELFDALKNYTHTDTSVRSNAAYCGKCTSELLAADPPYYAENITVNFKAYWENSWRGNRTPTLGEIMRLIGEGGRYVPGQVASANGNGARASPNERPDPPAQEKLHALRQERGGVREA